MAARKKYDESSIERYAGLAGIRKKPTMYAGEMNDNGLFTVLREPSDNCVDQALAGRNNLVHIIYDAQPNRYWVVDAGEGIPVGKKEFEDERGRKEKLSTLYVVTGLIHGGGNFSGDAISRGTHGVGQKLTNALSTFFKVWTFRDKAWWAIEYSQGKIVKDVHKTTAPKLPHGVKINKGTVVCFDPELPLFAKGSKIQPSDLASWCELTSYLVPNLLVKVTNSKGKTTTYQSKRGVLDFIDKRVETLKCTISGNVFSFSSKEVDIALAFSNAEGANLLEGYTNGLLNKDGGEHVKAVTDALVKSLAPYKGKLVYTPNDLKEGLLGLVNSKISAPRFNNQTKDKLLDDRVYPDVYPLAEQALGDFWKKNKALAKEVCTRASELRKRTADFLKDKKLMKKVKAANKGLAAKLADVSDQKTPIEDRELYLVEGDSAGGSSKVARFKTFQAVFSLKGKPLNVMDTTKDKVNKNNEIAGIFAGIGLDPAVADPLSKIRFGKIIVLADADIDGRHIRTLLYTVFWKYLPDLIKQGRLYVVDSPEYIAKVKDKLFFAPSKEELYKLAGTKKLDIRHLKGWGEAEPEDLEPMAFDPETRKLIRVLPPKDREGGLRFQALMGKKPQYRQQLLGVITQEIAAKAETKTKRTPTARTKSTGRRTNEKANETASNPKERSRKSKAPERQTRRVSSRSSSRRSG